MGSELSCPCGNRVEEEKSEPPKSQPDIIQEVMKGKLLQNQLLYSNICEKDDVQTKVCLIASTQLEGFFANRSLLTIAAKKEVNYYFNNIYIANFLEKDNLVFILLQYKPGLEDKSTLYLKPFNSYGVTNKKRMTSSFDYSAVYKVETINFVSSDKERIKEQILNDLDSKLKKEFLFYGIVNDPISSKNELKERINVKSTPNSTHNGVLKGDKNFKILYKKSKVKDNLNLLYSIYIHDERLNCENIKEILIDNKLNNKTLKSVMKERSTQPSKDLYYFIFEENLSSKLDQDFDFLVFKITCGTNTPDIFLKDIAKKINDENRINLECIINDEDGVFLVFSVLDIDLETPYDEDNYDY